MAFSSICTHCFLSLDFKWVIYINLFNLCVYEFFSYIFPPFSSPYIAEAQNRNLKVDTQSVILCLKKKKPIRLHNVTELKNRGNIHSLYKEPPARRCTSSFKYFFFKAFIYVLPMYTLYAILKYDEYRFKECVCIIFFFYLYFLIRLLF